MEMSLLRVCPVNRNGPRKRLRCRIGNFQADTPGSSQSRYRIRASHSRGESSDQRQSTVEGAITCEGIRLIRCRIAGDCKQSGKRSATRYSDSCCRALPQRAINRDRAARNAATEGNPLSAGAVRVDSEGRRPIRNRQIRTRGRDNGLARPNRCNQGPWAGTFYFANTCSTASEIFGRHRIGLSVKCSCRQGQQAGIHQKIGCQLERATSPIQCNGTAKSLTIAFDVLSAGSRSKCECASMGPSTVRAIRKDEVARRQCEIDGSRELVSAAGAIEAYQGNRRIQTYAAGSGIRGEVDEIARGRTGRIISASVGIAPVCASRGIPSSRAASSYPVFRRRGNSP